jgi:hypothetical protein
LINQEKRRQRFLRDALPIRLGGLAATLGRISSSARQSESPLAVTELLDEAKHLIEWTAAETEPETAAELVQIQRLITIWQKVWGKNHSGSEQRLLLSVEAKAWSDKVLELSGLL